MMKKKYCAVLTAALILTAGLSGCGKSGQQGGDGGQAATTTSESITLTFGHGQAEGHPYQLAALYFKDLVEEESGGQITVDVQPNGALGDEREMAEGLQMGTIDISVAVAAALSGFDQSMDVFNLPYLFDSREQAFQVLDLSLIHIFKRFAGQSKVNM